MDNLLILAFSLFLLHLSGGTHKPHAISHEKSLDWADHNTARLSRAA